MNSRVTTTQDTQPEKRSKGEKKAARKRQSRLEQLQAEHEELLDRVARARAKLDKRTLKLTALEARMSDLEKRSYQPEAEPLGQADANKDGARPARLILDPGGAPDAANSQAIAGLIRTLRGHGIAAEADVVAGRTVADLACEAAEQKQELVIVAGDDAAVESAAQGLAGMPATLGVIPFGSRNRLIRGLGIPLHVGPAAALIGMGAVRLLDLLEVKGADGECRYLLGSAGVGFAPVASTGDAASNSDPLSTVQDLGVREAHVQIEQQSGEDVEIENEIVVISNAPLFGAERASMQDTRIDDGVMNVFAFGSMDAGRVNAWLNSSAEEPAGSPSPVRSYQARRVRISGPGEDGNRKLQIRLNRGALSTIVGNGPALTLPVQSAPDDVETADDQRAKQGLRSLPILSFFGK